MKESPKKDAEKYWKEKEREIGEEIKGRDICEYISGYQGITERIWGLLYYTESSFYFQIFPRKNWYTSLIGSGKTEDSVATMNFRILWEEIKVVNLPPKRNFFFNFFSPVDYRVFIKYRINNQEDTLILMMCSSEHRNHFIDCYYQFKKVDSLKFW